MATLDAAVGRHDDRCNLRICDPRGDRASFRATGWRAHGQRMPNETDAKFKSDREGMRRAEKDKTALLAASSSGRLGSHWSPIFKLSLS
jgi:hypothetical protein